MDTPTTKEQLTFEEWLEFGFGKGWVSAPYCGTHEGPELTKEEEAEFDKGEDPCIVEMRLTQDLPWFFPEADDVR